jgi:hypothetical protein
LFKRRVSMAFPNASDIRATLLEIIQRLNPSHPTQSLQAGPILWEAADQLGIRGQPVAEQALLTEWQNLFRTGYLSWGFNISNPDPPFFHVTQRGQQALAQRARDPSNPSGYLAHLAGVATLNPIAQSYLNESLECYVHGLYKSAAVMIGGASESMILQLRDAVVDMLKNIGSPLPRNIEAWRVKMVLNALEAYFDQNRKSLPDTLRDEYDAYWPAYTQQIRASRNEAGHPSSVDPITADTVHASLLIFPELAKLQNQLIDWTQPKYSAHSN